jgi:hypothetical protein
LRSNWLNHLDGRNLFDHALSLIDFDVAGQSRQSSWRRLHKQLAQFTRSNRGERWRLYVRLLTRHSGENGTPSKPQPFSLILTIIHRLRHLQRRRITDPETSQ